MLPLLTALLAAHGGLDAWRDLGEIRWEVDITTYDGSGAATDPVRWVVRYPTSGRPMYEGNLAGLEVQYDHGVVTGADADRARYVLPTFNYIHSLPFKLADGGVRAEVPEQSPCRPAERALKISFDPGTGDNPDDWYVYCLDAQDRMTSVLFRETHERNPGIFWLDFSGFRDVDGVLLPTSLTYFATDAERARGPRRKQVDVVSVTTRRLRK